MHVLKAIAVVLVVIGVVPGAPRAALDTSGAGEGSDKRGCCSHHHGVCGCSDGVVMCCDRTASPTCTC